MTEYFKSRTQRYFAVALRWVIIAAFIFALTSYIGVSITDNVLTKIYSAKTTLDVKPSAPEEITDPGNGSSPTNFQAAFQTLESPEVLQPVISDLGLDKAWAERIFKTAEPLSADESLKYLEKNLRFNFKRGTTIVEIIVTSDDAKEAADIADAIATHYKKVRDDAEAERYLRAEQALSEQVAQQQKLVEDKKAEIQRLNLTLSPGKPDGSGGTLEGRLKELEDAKSDVAARDAFVREMASETDDQFFNAPGLVSKPDPDVAKLRADILKSEEAIANLLTAGSAPNKAALAPLQMELTAKKAQLHVIVQAVQRKMQNDLDGAKSHLVLLQKEVDEIEKLNPDAVKAYQADLRDLDQQQTLLDALNLRLKREMAEASQLTSSVQIVAHATVPTEPTRPNTRLCYAITAALAGLLSVMVASCLEIIFLISRAAEDPNRELLPAR